MGRLLLRAVGTRRWATGSSPGHRSRQALTDAALREMRHGRPAGHVAPPAHPPLDRRGHGAVAAGGQRGHDRVPLAEPRARLRRARSTSATSTRSAPTPTCRAHGLRDGAPVLLPAGTHVRPAHRSEPRLPERRLARRHGARRPTCARMYQRCPHLGCKPNFCTTNFWFECPCHGSRYDRLGTKVEQARAGAARPRPLRRTPSRTASSSWTPAASSSARSRSRSASRASSRRRRRPGAYERRTVGQRAHAARAGTRGRRLRAHARPGRRQPRRRALLGRSAGPHGRADRGAQRPDRPPERQRPQHRLPRDPRHRALHPGLLVLRERHPRRRAPRAVSAREGASSTSPTSSAATSSTWPTARAATATNGQGGVGPPLNDQAKLYNALTDGRRARDRAPQPELHHDGPDGRRALRLRRPQQPDAGLARAERPAELPPGRGAHRLDHRERRHHVRVRRRVPGGREPPTPASRAMPRPVTVRGWRDPDWTPAPGATPPPACWRELRADADQRAPRPRPPRRPGPIDDPGTAGRSRASSPLEATAGLRFTDADGDAGRRRSRSSRARRSRSRSTTPPASTTTSTSAPRRSCSVPNATTDVGIPTWHRGRPDADLDGARRWRTAVRLHGARPLPDDERRHRLPGGVAGRRRRRRCGGVAGGGESPAGDADADAGGDSVPTPVTRPVRRARPCEARPPRACRRRDACAAERQPPPGVAEAAG